MSSHLLLSELAALSSEAKRKCPDVRTASDAALAALRTRPDDVIGKSSPSTSQGAPPNASLLLQPITLACDGKTAPSKVVSIAVSLLQRVLSLRALPVEKVASVVDLLQHVVATRTDVDIHLKVLQAVATLLSNYSAVHDVVLSKTLRICFQLQQESRVGVINSTAAATLRQAVMTIFEKVRDEDAVLDGIKAGGEDAAAAAPLAAMTVQLHGAGPITLFPSSADAYRIMRDLNGLANNERAPFLELDSLSRTFTLELIESVLTNHARLFRNSSHPELLLSLREATCPLLIRAFNERSSFPITLRLMRILFVLLRQFSTELVVEVEILITILLRVITSETERRRPSAGTRQSVDAFPIWHKILAMEATRSLCSDSVFLRNLWKWFDGKDSKAQVFTSLVRTLSRVTIDSAGLVEKATPEHQLARPRRTVGQPTQPEIKGRSSSISDYANNLYDAAAGVAHSAVGGLAPLTEDAPQELRFANMPSVQLIDQLDKTEAPAMHPTYLLLLALQSSIQLAHSLASFLLPLHAAFVESHFDASQQAPPALDIVKLRESDRQEVLPLQDMLTAAGPHLIDVFGQTLCCRCDDGAFAEALLATRHVTIMMGVLGQEELRDALLTLLSDFAVPRDVLARLLSARRAAGEETVTTLSRRNRACAKALAQTAHYLAGGLETHWRNVLQALCDAEFILLRASDDVGAPEGLILHDMSIRDLSTVSAPFANSTESDHKNTSEAVFANCRPHDLINRISLVFSRTAALDASSLFSFLVSLCDLDADQIGLNGSLPSVERHTSLFHLGEVVSSNCSRLALDKNLERAWTLVVDHFLAAARQSEIRPTVRMKAAETLDSFLQSALEVAGATDTRRVQERVIMALSEQCILVMKRKNATDVDVRRAGYETLLTVLQVHGHSLEIRWRVVFDMIDAAAHATSDEEEKSGAPLVKAAFSALQVVSSELLSKLDTSELRQCTSTLILFAQQQEDVNVALTSNGAIWAITAEVSARADSGNDSDVNGMWIHVLSSLKLLTNDPRMQIRHGAISLFFNVLEQYGPSLPATMWVESVMPLTMWPLLRDVLAQLQQPVHGELESLADDSGRLHAHWIESAALALTGVGRVIRQAALEKLAGASGVWEELFEILRKAIMGGPDGVSQAAIKSYHHIVDGVGSGQDGASALDVCWKAWVTWCDLGRQLASATTVLSQNSLVAYVEAVAPLQVTLSGDLRAAHLDEMLSALKAALVCDTKSSRISDLDRLSALQKAVVSRVGAVQMTEESVAQVLQFYAELSLLAYGNTGSQSFLALNQVTTEAMGEICQQWSASQQIYSSGAVTQCLDALAIPARIRYGCPAIPNKAPDAWKASFVALSRIASTWCAQAPALELDGELVAKIWTSLVGAIATALTADCAAVHVMSPDMQEDEDMYDLMILATIGVHVWPRLGDAGVPSACVIQLASAIAKTSTLSTFQHNECTDGQWTPPESAHEDEDEDQAEDSCDPAAPRERLAYWCLDLLFFLCSVQPDLTPASVNEAQRVAVLALPSLIRRVRRTLAAYIARCKTAGGTPLNRIANEEVTYILSKLTDLQLWSGSLEMAMLQPAARHAGAADGLLTGQSATSSEVEKGQSTDPLLRHLYPLLCDFLLEVVPRSSSRTGRMELVACGSSQITSKPIVLPVEFTLGTLGKILDDFDEQHGDVNYSETGSTTAVGRRRRKEDPRHLVRRLLTSLGRSWV